MGAPMASHLASQNHEVSVYNRTSIKAREWKEKSPRGVVVTNLEKAIAETDVLVSCIGRDEDVELLCRKVERYQREKTYWVDHTTTSAILAKDIFKRLSAKNIAFIDAPVSGGEAGAINGTLTAMCGGRESDFLAVQPIIKCYAKSITLIGGTGAGQTAKMVNQVCLAGVLQGLSEGITLAKKSGLDWDKVIDGISKGAAQSWQMDNRANTMFEGKFDFGFAIDWMRKDLNICLQQAKSLGLELPALTMIDSFYKKIQQQGGGRLDTSALIKQF